MKFICGSQSLLTVKSLIHCTFTAHLPNYMCWREGETVDAQVMLIDAAHPGAKSLVGLVCSHICWIKQGITVNNFVPFPWDFQALAAGI